MTTKDPVNITTELAKTMGLSTLHHGCEAPKEVWQLLANHTAQGKQAARQKAFLFFDLTTLLPPHFSSEVVGGSGAVSLGTVEMTKLGSAHMQNFR